MSTFVLVHPAWFGGWCWRKVVPLLEAAGHEVYCPTLTGLGERAHLAHPGIDLGTHVEDVANMIVFEGLDQVVLVGNSSAGMVITGVAEQVPERIAELVYLDAFVPADGQCLLDLVAADRRPAMEALAATEGDGWLLPRFAAMPWEEFVPRSWGVTDPDDLDWMLARLRPTPFGSFTARLRLGNPVAARIARTYVRCTRWPHPGFDRSAEMAEREPGWRLRRLDAGHLSYITSPGELARVLLELTAAAHAGADRR